MWHETVQLSRVPTYDCGAVQSSPGTGNLRIQSSGTPQICQCGRRVTRPGALRHLVTGYDLAAEHAPRRSSTWQFLAPISKQNKQNKAESGSGGGEAACYFCRGSVFVRTERVNDSCSGLAMHVFWHCACAAACLSFPSSRETPVQRLIILYHSLRRQLCAPPSPITNALRSSLGTSDAIRSKNRPTD